MEAESGFTFFFFRPVFFLLSCVVKGVFRGQREGVRCMCVGGGLMYPR